MDDSVLCIPSSEFPDPLAGSSWSAPGTVAGFAQSSPNEVLMRYAAAERARLETGRVLDIGCGAGRNAVPLAQAGWDVTGLDLSWPMLVAGLARAREAQVDHRIRFALAAMEALPVPDASADLIVAHGIWNLARSAAQFRRAVVEAARAARPGAALFVFTFSRNTFPPAVAPVEGESFVYTQFSGQPQCFLSAEQLVTEMAAAGFVPDARVPLTEYNRPPAGLLRSAGPPVIYEAAFRCIR
jgi:SAM-dependent methyltransferase